MTLPGRDAGEVQALVTDRYLDVLLAGDGDLALLPGDGPGDRRPRETRLDAAVRAASRRLAADLPRFHPSFRFEERLALRLAEAAAQMRMPMAAGPEGHVVRMAIPGGRDTLDPLAVLPDDEAADLLNRPLIIGGAVAASAISIAGAAWLAWRHRPSPSPMARAIRAAHAARRT